MKKITALLLALLTVLSFSACAGGGESSDDTTDVSVEQSEISTESSELSEDIAGIVRGTVSGTVYTNTFAGFTFTAPETWAYYTDEKLAYLVGLTEADLQGDLDKAFEKNNTIYDMTVADANDKSSVSVSYKKVEEGFDLASYVTEQEEQIIDMGGTVLSRGETSLGSRKFSTIDYGQTLTQKSYYALEGEYLIEVTISTDGSEFTVNRLEASFK